MTQISVAQLLQKLAGTQVLALGDVMLDRFIYGKVERVSPEAPIPILKVEKEITMLGGAGNVLRNLRALGAEPHFLTVVGQDAAGREVQQLAAEELGGAAHLLSDSSIKTTIKERYIAGTQQLLRADRDTPEAPKDAILDILRQNAIAKMEGCGALLLSDYGKGVLRNLGLHSLITEARNRGLPVVVDPKGRDFSIYSGAQFITPNRQELSDATGLPTDSDEEVVAACREVIAKQGISGVLATRSEQGMTLVSHSGEVHHLPARALEVYDVSGAGDTVVAAFGAGLAAGLSPVEAAELANLAAGVVVGKRGTAVAYPDEILQSASSSPRQGQGAKALDLGEALQEVARWRAQGLRIGFANGCFDLLHAGHLSLLEQARSHCDRLIVAINSDESVSRLKGPRRPLQNQQDRATLLSALSCVDLVVIFAEDTPLNLIEALRPDILVKGSDYTRETVVGADLVEGYGGKILLAELLPERSTTRLIERGAKG